ncbi:hypothetical protein [Nocardia sp. NPDC004711]
MPDRDHLDEVAELLTRDLVHYIHAGWPTWEGLSNTRREAYLARGCRAAEGVVEKLTPSSEALAEAYMAGYTNVVIGGICEAVAGHLSFAAVAAHTATASSVAKIIAQLRDEPAVFEFVGARLAEISAATPTN